MPNAPRQAIPERHQHPIAMFKYIYRYLFLLLFPLARGLRYIRSPQGLYAWVKGTWQDLLVVFLLLLLSYLGWQFHTYTLDEEGFTIRRGVFLHRTSYIPRHNIVTLSVERPLYLRPLRAVHIAIDTDAGGSRQADFSLTVGEPRAKEILDQRQSHESQPLHAYSPRWYHVVVLSLLISNSFSGIFLLATTFQQSGRLLGKGFRQQLLGDLETVAGYVTWIPRTAALIALVLIGGWGVSAIRNMFRYLPFRVSRYKSFLTIRTGLFTRRDYSCSAKSVNFVDYRQSIVSRLLHLDMVFINCIGYGKEKNSMSVLVPVSSIRHSESEVRRLLPEFTRRPVTLKAAFLSIYRYVFYPLWTMILLYPVSRQLQSWFPQWQELIYYLTTMAYIPCAWQLLVKTIDRFTAGISHRDRFFNLKYSKWYTFHTVLIPEDKVVAYALTQTPFQAMAHNCDVLVYTYNEASRYHRIRNLPMKQAQELFAGIPSVQPQKGSDVYEHHTTG